MITCALCRRKVYDEVIDDPGAIQEHHLVPENRNHSPTVDLCRPCHEQIHAVFTNDELRESYDSIEALRGAERLRGYLNWIRGTDKLKTEVRTSEHVRRNG